MNRFTFFLKMGIVIVLLYTLTGCGSSMMVQGKRMEFTGNDQAVVTFLRPSMFGGAIQFGIWDSENFIGVLTPDAYIQYLAQPGDHYFMARAENWSCVKATLEGGKHYYIIGKVFPGVWKARVALDPIKSGDESQAQIDQWLTNLNPIQVAEDKRDSYVSPRLDQVREARSLFESGEGKCEEMTPTDGR